MDQLALFGSALLGGLMAAVASPVLSHWLTLKQWDADARRGRNRHLRGVVEDAIGSAWGLRLNVARGGGIAWVDFLIRYAPFRAAIPRIDDDGLRESCEALLKRLERIALAHASEDPTALEPASLDELVNSIARRMDELKWPESSTSTAR